MCRFLSEQERGIDVYENNIGTGLYIIYWIQFFVEVNNLCAIA